MSRIFIGVGYGSSGGSDVYVAHNGRRERLTRVVKRIRRAYSWDQGGPRSVELSRAMLSWLINGSAPPWSLYRGFTSDVIAQLPVPMCEGECWRISESEIKVWLRDVGWLSTLGSLAEEHTAKWGVFQRAIHSWKRRARDAAAYFQRRVAE